MQLSNPLISLLSYFKIYIQHKSTKKNSIKQANLREIFNTAHVNTPDHTKKVGKETNLSKYSHPD
jgi:hypothetical protein